MSIFTLLTKAVGPVTTLIDSLHTSEAEKLGLKAELLGLQNTMVEHVLELEKTTLEAQASIITQEAKAESWLTRSWRPLLMIWFAGLAGAHWMGLTPDTLPQETVDDLFTLVQIGVGGYIGGRSVEKLVPAVVSAVKQKEE